MNKTKVTICLIVLLLVVPVIFAQNQPQEQTNKIFLNPFYLASMSGNTNYTYTVTINPPDKISYVSSAIITFDMWINPTRTFTLWVNGKSCNNPDYTITTTYAGAGRGVVYYDCSNIITKAGSYNVTMRTSGNIGASTSWLDVTYSNRPKGSVEVHGTEYTYGQIGKVWLQLLDSNGDEVNDGVCYVDIFTPTGGVLVSETTMINMNNKGMYYYDLEIPIEQGVYPAIGQCFYEATQTFNNATTYFVEIGSYDNGAMSDVYSIDGNKIRFKESTVNPVRNISVGFNFSEGNVCSNISQDLLTGITIRTVTKFDSVNNDDITLHVWNYTSSSWITLPNKVLEGNTYRDVSNSLLFNNITKAGLVNGSGTHLRIKFNDTSLADGGTSDLDVDYINVACNQLSNPEWQEVKGSSELHVSSDKLYISELESGELTNETLNEKFVLSYLIASGTSYYREDVLIELETWKDAFPCQHLKQLEAYNETSDDWYNLTFTTYLSSDDTCGVRFYLDLDKGQNYPVRITSDNFWKREYLSKYERLDFQEENLDIGCINYQMAKGYDNYTLPLANYVFTNNDTLYRMCYMYKDWKEAWIQESSSFYYLINTNYNFTDDEMTQLEGYYYHTINSAEDILNFGNGIYYGWMLGDAYSVAILNDPYPPTNPDYALYFANISTSYLEYIKPSTISNISIEQVWNYSNRSLSNFNFDVVNETEITENVWNYNGTVNPSLLSQFSQAVWNYFNSTINFIGLIADAVWTRTPDRNLTYYENFTIPQEDLTNYTRIEEIVNNATVNINLTELVEDVWSYNNRSLTSEYMNNITVEEIWNYVSRNLTYYEQTDETNYTKIVEDVWNYFNRTLTDYNQTAQVDLTDYGLIQVMVWNATDRNLTYYPTQVDMTNYTQVAQSVWEYINRTLTLEYINNITAQDIWDYTNRTLTYYEHQDMTNYTKVVEDVWSYVNRSLTYYPAQTDLTNYTLIAEMVWNNINRSLTEFNFDVVNETEISETVWNYFNRTLSDFNFTVNTNFTINTSEISEAVWSHVNRTLTDYNQTTQLDLTNYSLVQEVVWNATSRTLTSFGFDVVDEGEVAENVWTYTPDRNLTYYELVNVTNLTVNIDASQVAQEVWSYNGTVSDNILSQFRDYIECSLDRIFNIEEGWGVDIPAC